LNRNAEAQAVFARLVEFNVTLAKHNRIYCLYIIVWGLLA
jgi:hypothetical protein